MRPWADFKFPALLRHVDYLRLARDPLGIATSVQLSAPSHSARAQVTIYDLELLYQSKTRRAGCSNGLR